MSVVILFIAISCKRDYRSSKSTSSSKDTSMVVANKETPKTIDTINFYFENSGSMNGYLSGKNLKQTIAQNIKSYAWKDIITIFHDYTLKAFVSFW